MPQPKRGEIWWIDRHPSRGSEQRGKRPSLIVQSDFANDNPRYRLTITASLTTRERSEVMTRVRIDPTQENGLERTSYVMCEQILTIDRDRLKQKIGTITTDELDQVDEALLIALGIER
jgi:mRNA interferase MazF